MATPAEALEWSPSSWRRRAAAQQPAYCSEAGVARAVEEISHLPPLVTSWEVRALQSQLAEAARGERFLLQAGDCAETFDECNSEIITKKLKVLLQMSLMVVHGGEKPVIRVGQFAGQYAKPPAARFEIRNGLALPSYQGDLINRAGFTEADRVPDPALMLRGYARAGLTLNFIRALVTRGLGDPRHLEYWHLDFVGESPMAEEYRRRARNVGEAVHFMEALLGSHPADLRWADFFISHEGLLLPYEQAQTRRVPRQEGWFNLASHFPWIGVSTLDPAGAHVEYFRGIRNPIGIKVDASMTPESLIRLVEILDPRNEPGRLTLIHRFGNECIAGCLPPLIEAVQSAGRNVLWCCDPMHGNTRVTNDGLSTRDFDDILGELDQAFDIHAEHGACLGGVQIELTGENVTECTGGARKLCEADLKRDYRSHVDPRLNYEQALEIAMFIATELKAFGRP